MTYGPPFSMEPGLDENISFPAKWEEFLNFNTKLSRDIARKINKKENGQYLSTEIVNGKTFVNAANPDQTHAIFRKVIDCGALPGIALIKNINHNIAGVDNTWFFIPVFGGAINPAIPRWIPLPNAAPYQISLEVTAAQIIMRTAIDLSAFTQSYVVLEFWKV